MRPRVSAPFTGLSEPCMRRWIDLMSQLGGGTSIFAFIWPRVFLLAVQEVCGDQ